MHTLGIGAAALASLACQALALSAPADLQGFLSKNPITTTQSPPTAKVAAEDVVNDDALKAALHRVLTSTDRSPCPVDCSIGDAPSANWTAYHSLDRLELCDETMLHEFVLANPLDDEKTQTTIRSCTVRSTSLQSRVSTDSCEQEPTTALTSSVSADIQLVKLGGASDSGIKSDSISVALKHLQDYAAHHSNCNKSTAFVTSGGLSAGFYAGSKFSAQDIGFDIISQFASSLSDGSGTVLAQLCDEQRGPRYAMGIIVSGKQDLPRVQQAVQTWKNGSCVDISGGSSSSWKTVDLKLPVASNTTMSQSSANKTTTASKLARRDECRTIKAVSGDSCDSLASECGISLSQFYEYNPDKSKCDPLFAGRVVCCTEGSLPNLTPKPSPDGTCATHRVTSTDLCGDLAAAYDIDKDDIETWNKNTWGWMGCRNLQIGNNICLSAGNPPLPAADPNAVCGPAVAGTAQPGQGVDLASLNPCPLKACCDIWGQCGTTEDFCTDTRPSGAAPGTAAPGSAGCISNCGTAIVTSPPPSHFRKIAYFEGYNQARPCLRSSIASIANGDYTDVHFAFAELTSSFDVDLSKSSAQFNMFLNLEANWRKVLSFGGWTFSTEPALYHLFRTAVNDENRARFITKVVDFVRKYRLDGVDFDWEYPGETDMKPIPPSTVTDSINYLLFIYQLRNALNDSGMDEVSLSIAAPASYWYLKGFFIEALAASLDYIVYMTYDLHGQWDFANKWSQPGCGGGNCLRSGVNLTETLNALSLITKAGVPSNKVVVGVTSYGRSFQMTTPGCHTEMCNYVGPESPAAKGMCTQTSGYISNAEIDYAAANDPNAMHLTDDSYSDILVYGGNQWVSYMSDQNKAVRTLLYKNMNFGGTTDWAVDLGGTKETIAGECASLSKSDSFFPTCSPAAPVVACTSGTGEGDYAWLCAYSCVFNYCPSTFCTCTSTGAALAVPLETQGQYCPVSRLDTSFSGLCQFSCRHGYCPEEQCVKRANDEFCNNKPFGGIFDENQIVPGASCQQLGTDNVIKADYWDKIDATKELTKYINKYNGDTSGHTNFVLDLANPLGIGQSSAGCARIDTNTCQAADCLVTTPETGWKYATLLSIAHLNNVMRSVYTAVGAMPPSFHIKAMSMVDTFSYRRSDDTLFWQEFATALSTMLVVGTTLSGNVEFTAVGALLGGLTTGIITDVLAKEKEEAKNWAIDALEWANEIRKGYVNMWTDVIAAGNESMIPLFQHGAFLAVQNLPVINGGKNQITQDEIQKHILDIWDATLVNKKWKKNVSLYCYPMSRSVFDAHTSNWASNLQSWVDHDGGQGCYLQGISSFQLITKYEDPPGSDKLGTKEYPFTVTDVIQSSYATFVAGGFNYTMPVHDNIQNVVEYSTNDITGGKLWSAPGMFNLPVCDPSGEWSLEKFYKNMNYGGYGNYASLCGCAESKDKNGKRWKDFYRDVREDCSCGVSAGCCVQTGSINTCPT